MYAAANFAWVNRSAMTYQARQTFEKIFDKSSRELGMHLVYDVCHNIAKVLICLLDSIAYWGEHVCGIPHHTICVVEITRFPAYQHVCGFCFTFTLEL